MDCKNIRKGVENGTYKKSTNINRWASDTKLEYRNNSNDNDVLPNRRISQENEYVYDTNGGQQGNNNRTEIVKQNSGNEQIENSNKSSFSISEINFKITTEGDINKLTDNGIIHFDNPLVLDNINTSETGWKKTLSEMFDNKTGRNLTEAVRKQVMMQ